MIERRGARSSVLFPGLVPPARDGAWAPAVDVYQSITGDEWLIKVDAAGVSPRDIDVRLEGRDVVIRGSRRDETVCEGYRVMRMEICYSAFERRIGLPCGEGLLGGCELSWGIRDGLVMVFVRAVAQGGS